MSRILDPIILDFDTSVFFDVKWKDYRCSCIQHQKTEQSDLHPENKMPECLVLDNTAIHQKFFDDDEVDYNLLSQRTGIDVKSVSVIMQQPGNIIPIHRDMFHMIKSNYDTEGKQIVRANIFLEDWKSGHYLEFDKDPCTNWKANEGFVISEEVTHLSANAGLENKYTVQISGFYNDNKIHESPRQ